MSTLKSEQIKPAPRGKTASFARFVRGYNQLSKTEQRAIDRLIKALRAVETLIAAKRAKAPRLRLTA